MELVNLHPDTVFLMFKLLSVNGCSNTLGQAALCLDCCWPKPGDPSYPVYEQEKAERAA